MYQGIPCLVLPRTHRDPKGYGRCGVRRFGKVERYYHRVAWIDAHGMLPPPETPWILHHCDVPECEEPSHLYAGTRADNARDKTTRNRQSARLGEDQVREIRRLYLAGWMQIEIAEEFKLVTSHVSKIINRQLWAHLDDEYEREP